MAAGTSGQGLYRANYGITVVRATGNLAQTTNSALFNVNTGRVLVTGIVGICTTVVQTQANNFRLTTNSTTGNVTTNLCADLDIGTSPLVVGEMLGITGTPATAAVRGSSVIQTNEVYVAVGTIRQVCSASNTGQIQWTISYVPLDPGASITAA